MFQTPSYNIRTDLVTLITVKVGMVERQIVKMSCLRTIIRLATHGKDRYGSCPVHGKSAIFGDNSTALV